MEIHTHTPPFPRALFVAEKVYRINLFIRYTLSRAKKGRRSALPPRLRQLGPCLGNGGGNVETARYKVWQQFSALGTEPVTGRRRGSWA